MKDRLEDVWAKKPRVISVVVDNPSWIVPYAQKLVGDFNESEEDALFCGSHDKIRNGVVAFYLGCIKITPEEVLKRNHYNIVVHQSDLPKGRGFSPLSWQILEGKNVIPVSVLEAVKDVDEGPIYYKDQMVFEGHELVDELREVSALTSIRLCKRFMDEENPPIPTIQEGEPSYYQRRGKHANELDPMKSLESQFDLLRIADSEKYPAYFKLRDNTYRIMLEKIRGNKDDSSK